ADVEARVAEPVTGKAGLRHQAGCRAEYGLRVVGGGHPVTVGERLREPAGRCAGVRGRQQAEPEGLDPFFGPALLDRPPLRCLPPRLRALLLPVLALTAHQTRMPQPAQSLTRMNSLRRRPGALATSAAGSGCPRHGRESGGVAGITWSSHSRLRVSAPC